MTVSKCEFLLMMECVRRYVIGPIPVLRSNIGHIFIYDDVIQLIGEPLHNAPFTVCDVKAHQHTLLVAVTNLVICLFVRAQQRRAMIFFNVCPRIGSITEQLLSVLHVEPDDLTVTIEKQQKLVLVGCKVLQIIARVHMERVLRLLATEAVTMHQPHPPVIIYEQIVDFVIST